MRKEIQINRRIEVDMIKKGTIVRCPGCKVDLYHLTRDLIEESSEITGSLMEPIGNVSTCHDGDQTKCPFCGRPYIAVMIHTDKGWK